MCFLFVNDKSQITLSYLMYVDANLLIIITQLMESVCLYPKVTPLICFHCTFIERNVSVRFFHVFFFIESLD